VLVQLNDYDAALKACDNAVRANNNSSVAYLARGAAYSSMGYFGKALEDLQASQKLQPQRPLVYFMLGEAYYKLRRVDEALANYELAEQKGMHNAKLYVSRAKSRIRLKEEEARAIKDLKMAEADDKGNAEIYLAWSSLYKNKNQLKEAFPFLERAKQLDPKSVEVYRFRCDIFPNRSNLEIIQDCNEAIRLEPANPLNYLFRGRVYAKMDCQDLADANYDAGFHLLAMQILEDRRQARYKSDELNEARHLGNLAFAAILAGKYERAIAESDNALKLAKDQLWIELNKAHALTFAKREDEGKALYLSHEGESFGGRQWKHMLQDDFRWLRSAVRDKGDRVNDRIGALFDSVEHTLNMESTRGPQPDLDISRPCSQL
jgi:tetratricopeptide (TPR) repeat protein